jgi:hypothetical protein
VWRASASETGRASPASTASPNEIADTPNAILQVYAEELVSLHAEEMLNAILVADMPHMEKADRAKVHRSYERHTHAPEAEVPKVDLQTDRGRGIAAGLGIGFVQEDAEVESVQEPHA